MCNLDEATPVDRDKTQDKLREANATINILTKCNKDTQREPTHLKEEA